MNKSKTYIFNKCFETRKELTDFIERIDEIIRVFNMYNHRLRELTRFKILHNVSNALICLKVEIEHFHESD